MKVTALRIRGHKAYWTRTMRPSTDSPTLNMFSQFESGEPFI